MKGAVSILLLIIEKPMYDSNFYTCLILKYDSYYKYFKEEISQLKNLMQLHNLHNQIFFCYYQSHIQLNMTFFSVLTLLNTFVIAFANILQYFIVNISNISNSQYLHMHLAITSTSSQPEKMELKSHEKLRQSRRQDIPLNIRSSMFKKSAKNKFDNEDKQSKITKYINNSNSISKPRITLDEINLDQKNGKENRVVQFSNKLSEKDEEIRKIKVSNQSLKIKINESREEIKKRQKIIAQSMLEVAELKRQQKKRIDKKLGYFTDNFRKFVQGTTITALKDQLKIAEKALAKLEEEKRKSSGNTAELICLLSSYQFKSREISEIKVELQSREKQIIEYRERLRLADKEQKSSYCTQGWPIIYEKYQTLQLLGSGGFGQVYKCFDLQRNKIVAIKKMKFDPSINIKHFQQFCRHVRRQIDIQIKLSHPNIAKLQNVLEINEDKRCIVFELEYCRGPELSAYMKKHKFLQEKQAKLYIKQIICALNYLYSLKEKVIHYDLKPSNIIFHEGVIKILDFGLCKTIDSNSEQTKIQLTSQGVGTYWYLPPETFEPYDPRISSKVDIWSVGVIFYQMLYGKRPFGHGLSQNQIYEKGVILKATKVEFPPDPTKKFKISEGAKEFICACLKYEPDERLSPTEAYEHPYLNIKR